MIALFYTAQVSWAALAAGFLVALVATNLLHARHPAVYALLCLGLWAAFLESSVHATIAGVLLARTIPVRTRVDTAEFFRRAYATLHDFDRAGEESPQHPRQRRTAGHPGRDRGPCRGGADALAAAGARAIPLGRLGHRAALRPGERPHALGGQPRRGADRAGDARRDRGGGSPASRSA